MTQREELEERIEKEGVDPQKKGVLVDVAQYGNVLATVWNVPGADGITSFILKFEHSGDYEADGLPFGASDWESVNQGLKWTADKLILIFNFLELAEVYLRF